MPTSEPMDADSGPGIQSEIIIFQLLMWNPANRLTVAAIAITGDMRHTADQPYNVGTGAGANGVS